MNKDIDNQFNYAVGQNIARIRKQTGLSQAEMEDLCQISRAYYGRLELGVHSPTISILKRISDTLGVDITELFKDENGNTIM